MIRFSKRHRVSGACVFVLTMSLSGPNFSESLADIYELAVSQDPVIAAARATYRADAEAAKIAKAGLLPYLSVTASYTDNSNSEDSFNAYSQKDAEVDTEIERYAINLNQPLFDLPAWYSFQRGKHLNEGAKAEFAADQQNLILRVSEAYFNVLRAYDDTQTRNAEERAIKRQLEQTRERYEVGLVPITDVHEAVAVFDEAAVNTLESRGALRIAFEQLQVLTGRNHRVLAGLGDKFSATAPEPANAEAWASYAINNNFSLKVAKFVKDAAASYARSNKYQHLPKLSLAMGYDKTVSNGSETGTQQFIGNDLGGKNTFGRDNNGASIQINLRLPIYSGGMLHAQRRQAAHLSVSAEQNHIAAKRNTVQSARSIHQSVITNVARVNARRQSIVSADSALKATQAGYEVGTRNIVDVLVAQRTLYHAQRNFANTRYDYIISLMRLKQVAGQLSPDDVYQLNAWLQPELVIQRETN